MALCHSQFTLILSTDIVHLTEYCVGGKIEKN